MGDACTGPSDCSGIPPQFSVPDCLPASSYPGGYCTVSCSNNAGCPMGSICSFSHFCVKACTMPSECRTAEGYFCNTVSELPPYEGCIAGG